jgi:peptidoglycan/LPS O-acetylase OafA/YrhL
MTMNDPSGSEAPPGAWQRRTVYGWMDAMRALAAFAVVISHARDLMLDDFSGQFAWAPFYLITGLGHQAVIVFFVLSGFWVGRSVLRNSRQADFWRSYLVQRLSRLYIVLIPALLLGGLLDYTGGLLLHLPFYQFNPSHSFAGLSANQMLPETLLGNALFLQTIVVPCFGSNGPLWSLACEFWFYLWFPAVITAVRGRPGPALASLLVAILHPELLGYFLIWLMGVAVYLLDRHWPEARPAWAFARPRIVLLMLAAVVLGALLASRSMPGVPGDTLLGLAFSVLILYLLRCPAALPAPPRALAFYGSKASYSLYVVHFPMIVFVLATLDLKRLPADVPSALGVVSLAAAAAGLALLFASLTEMHTERARQIVMRSRFLA